MRRAAILAAEFVLNVMPQSAAIAGGIALAVYVAALVLQPSF